MCSLAFSDALYKIRVIYWLCATRISLLCFKSVQKSPVCTNNVQIYCINLQVWTLYFLLTFPNQRITPHI